jgi:hypothetical protein
MSGFVIELVAPGTEFGGALKLVDLGQCELVQSRIFGTTRIAWARWQATRQLTIFETPDRFLFVEGQPDRLPAYDEELTQWLNGRAGSFRGFQVKLGSPDRPPRICAFVDPLATRPIYLLSTPKRICLADKLATVVANTPGLDCEWNGLLECAALGSMYSSGTTVSNAEELAPGEVLETEGVAIVRRRKAPYQFDSAAIPDPCAPARLEEALRIAIGETWTEADGRLLLTGGLDSRLILGLSEGKRKAMTIDWWPRETAITRQVAAACGADLEVIPFSPDDYHEMMLNGFLVTGAMHQSRYVNQLGIARRWRQAGIPAITHGYFHNTVYRGWLSERWQRYSDPDTPLAAYMGSKAHYFDIFDQYFSIRPKLLSLLSREGHRYLKYQLGCLADSIVPVIVDGFDLTFERRVLQNIARQVYFSIFLGWIEEIDVESPIFHAAIWHWYASTHAADRYNDNAVNLLYQTVGRGLADIPDFNTGHPVPPVAQDPAQLWRNQFWFPMARLLVRTARRLQPQSARNHSEPPSPLGPSQDWDSAFRQKVVIEALCAGIEEIKGKPLFNAHALESTVVAYLNGDDSVTDALWAAAITGQWHRFVQNAGADHPAVRTVVGSDRVSSGEGSLLHNRED